MNETFKLNFISNGEGEVVIDEPVGFDSADFNLEQESKRYGRDVSFSGGESKFKFYRMRNHYYERLMYYYETFGWESEVQLIIEIDGIDNIIGDLDFKEADTNQLESFECKVIQQSNQAIIKRRKDLNVDMFASEDIDGNAINPLTTENILIISKPLTQNSRWVSTDFYAYTGSASTTKVLYQNPLNQIELFGIDDTLSYIDRYISTTSLVTPEAFIKDMAFIDAQNNIINCSITLSNLVISYFIDTGEAFDDNNTLTGGVVTPRMQLYVGTDDNIQAVSSQFQYLEFTKEFIGNESVTRFGDRVGTADRWDLTFSELTIDIGDIPRGNKLYIVFYMDRYSTIVEWISGQISATSSSIAYNTIASSIRLHDCVSQNILSISSLGISFPFADVNGEMYDQRVFNGNLLRNITDRPFYVSLKDIEGWLPEINGDYEVSDEVFFGKYEDFYTNNEIGVFTAVRFDDYKKSFNDSYAINEFNYKYKKFQSQKENEVENTFDVVHGESQWSVLNKFVENKKSAEVGFVRDSFYIEEQRRKALDLTENTSTQDDDTIFIIDTIEATEDSVFEENDFLQHSFDTDTTNLTLKNDGSFSFLIIGLAIGETFEILGGDQNAGSYTIVDVSVRDLTLSGINASSNGDGERVTAFRYIVSLETAQYKTWTNEGFNYIDNINNKDKYANLKYTVKRNIKRFYNQYLATANIYTGKAIKNTLYKNNPDLSMNYNGLQTVEGDAFTPTNPILSPYKHDITLITDFLTYKALEDAVRTTRGYIRTYDAKGHVIKVYPQKMVYVNSAEIGELKIVGEEKYQRSVINITYANTGFITINDEYRTPLINYSYNEEIFSIFDEDYRLLYEPVFWHKISVNDAIATSKTQLIQWLELLN